MFRALILACALSVSALTVAAQDLQSLLQSHADEVAKPSRRTVEAVVKDLAQSGLNAAPEFLLRWQNKDVYQSKADGMFYYVRGTDPLTLIDIETGAEVGSLPKSELVQLKPNAGVRGVLGGALVQFQLSDPNPQSRIAALDSIARDPSADQLAPLAASIEGETDDAILARKERLLQIVTARFSNDTGARIASIEALSEDVSVDVRAVLNQLLVSTDGVAPVAPEGNIARIRRPGKDFDVEVAYAELTAAGLAQPRIAPEALKAALIANIVDGEVAGTPVHQLDTNEARIKAYSALAEVGLVPPFVSDEVRDAALASHVFYTQYAEPNAEVTTAARDALNGIETRVGIMQMADLTLDGLSLASIYFLAAIGLAITFGVMGVINMAHGEFIMMGAYTGYVIQQVIPDYTISILVALPVAFAVTFGAGVTMERLVIRHLYHRPLETLLATFGISVALQQLAKNIFGTQARPLTSPSWLDGALVFNDVVSISYIRIAIFVLAVLFLGLIIYILKRTRLGLEVRAVTQNPGMAASMGINPDRINMLTFGLGSGIAGIAGVAIGLYAKVTSEMGADYIVQSFMTVVVGGVGNVWGTLAGASLIGFLQKGIEWLNPSNTLAAQTYMILFIIIFIQFRPRGIVALKGRAAGN